MTRKRLSIVLGCLTACLVLPSAAAASRGQATILEDGTQIVNADDATRARSLDELKSLGVDVVKIRLIWRDVAPAASSEQRPSFDASDPAAYAGGFAKYDATVNAAAQRGMRVWIMISPPAPEWATGRGERRGVIGAYKPDPADFGRFVEAVGKRYSGSAGPARVSTWSIWNEPNHPLFLQPLSERIGGILSPSSPHQYRRLYVAARNALGNTGHNGDTILFGEILPIGQSKRSATNTIRPIEFIREFYCVDRNYRAYRGRSARLRDCTRFPRIRTSGFAYHAYTRPGGPRVRIRNRDDATIGQIGRVEAAFNRIASRTRRVGRGLAIWNSEFGLQSDPPDCGGFGTSLRNQARHMNEAEFISFRHGRVKSYSNYLLIDDAINLSFPKSSFKRYRGFQSGLRYGANALNCRGSGRQSFGAAKPAYAAFRTPIYVRKRGSRSVSVFGRARPQGGAAQQIEILRNGRVVKRVTASGYFLTPVRASSSGIWQLRWSAGGRTYESRSARARTGL